MGCSRLVGGCDVDLGLNFAGAIRLCPHVLYSRTSIALYVCYLDLCHWAVLCLVAHPCLWDCAAQNMVCISTSKAGQQGTGCCWVPGTFCTVHILLRTGGQGVHGIRSLSCIVGHAETTRQSSTCIAEQGVLKEVHGFPVACCPDLSMFEPPLHDWRAH
jgi:hypothetical protein